ncbi:hypothetical protein E1I18_02095 [Mycoplasmopsis mucosicanis]|uniref:Uncharacterized protein n=1 Tax=Mycoplasmopsis mucosicanis TaxID=458208 RepID=A0A507SNF5_9BACT|nr:AAA family ATPase [Mycoplasmopsis mucosicanis]TQC51564.1 hypothetical protein E1I18_02095 [Mycoplasmopsis mucosicanis]
MNNEKSLNQKGQLFQGMFKKILSGGEKVDWKYTLAIFVARDGKNFSVFMTNQPIKLMTMYEISVSDNKKSNYNSKQLDSLKVREPDSNEELEKILIASNSGIGRQTLAKIKDKIGKQWVEQFKKDQSAFKELLSSKSFDALVAFFQTYTNKSYNFFVASGLSSLYESLYKDLGDVDDSLIETLKQINPYTLVYEKNYTFSTIDNLATLLKLEDTPQRLKALIFCSVEDLMNSENSTLVNPSLLINKIQKDYKNYSFELITETIQEMINTGILCFNSNHQRITTKKMHDKEMYLAATLLRLNKDKKVLKIDLHSSLSTLQQHAFKNAVENGVSIISGFPGTGKSFVIKNIIEYFVNNEVFNNDDIAVLAPTGRAAINIKTKWNINARTIHSYFRLSPSPHKTTIDCTNPAASHKLLIIDEFSMVNTDVFYEVISHSKNLEKIIFVGDVDQLPCIGPGNLLDDLINSNKFTCVKLDEIFRTDRKEIPDHFLAVKNKKNFSFNTNDIVFLDTPPAVYYDELCSQYAMNVEEFGLENTAVLIPMHKTINGIRNTNKILQQWRLNNYMIKNSEPESFSFGVGENARKFYVGDKVVQNENDYDLDVYNGEIGFIKSYNQATKSVVVDFGYKSITYSREIFGQYVSLGYALSVHKFQGSESQCVIFVTYPEHNFIMSTKLIYTAVSRAKEKLVILGDLNYYKTKVIKPSNEQKAITTFSEFINTEV